MREIDSIIPGPSNASRSTGDSFIAKTTKELVYTLEEKKDVTKTIQELKIEYDQLLADLRRMGYNGEIIEYERNQDSTQTGVCQQTDEEPISYGMSEQYETNIKRLENIYMEILVLETLIVNDSQEIWEPEENL